MTPLFVLGTVVGGLCWIVQLVVAMFSRTERASAVLTLIGLSFMIVVLAVALGTVP